MSLAGTVFHNMRVGYGLKAIGYQRHEPHDLERGGRLYFVHRETREKIVGPRGPKSSQPAREIVEFGDGQEPLEPGVLTLELFETLGLVGLHAAVLPPPAVVGLIGDTDQLDSVNGSSYRKKDRLVLRSGASLPGVYDRMGWSADSGCRLTSAP